jgi:hypothetical protein
VTRLLEANNSVLLGLDSLPESGWLQSEATPRVVSLLYTFASFPLFYRDVVVVVIWWDWDLSFGPQACQADTLSLEPLCQLFLC